MAFPEHRSDIPEGWELVEVGAYIDTTWRKALVEPLTGYWYDGIQQGGAARGNSVEEPHGGWERLFVLRPKEA